LADHLGFAQFGGRAAEHDAVYLQDMSPAGAFSGICAAVFAPKWGESLRRDDRKLLEAGPFF
jgi:hypothetical protein